MALPAVAQTAPDYSQSTAWAAYPGHPSSADEVPAGVPATPSNPAVDVFFIHPTTDLSLFVGNADFDAGGATGKRINNGVLRFQASVFNGCCRIFAPHYRQASIKAITSNTEASQAAADLAYSDINRAFDQFLIASHGRPFIIASHSQGSVHGLRLLQQRIIGTPLQKRLVAAYLIGTAMPLEIESLGMPVCRSATAYGCAITWNSVEEGKDDRRRREDTLLWWQGHYQTIAGRPMVCVNPLTWTLDGSAPASANLGAVYSDGPRQAIPAPIAQLTGAHCANGLLGVEPATKERRHFRDLLSLIGIYHDFDYSLFYMNIRANLAQRIAAYLAQQH